MKKPIQKYYMKLTEDGQCLECCHVKNSGLWIGSVGCEYMCKYLISHGHDKKGSWIKCSKIKKATGYL